MTEYLKTTTPDKYIKVEIKYSLGGMNYGTYRIDPRGYYLHVTPVTRSEFGPGMWSESFMAFSGYRQLLNEVNRQSKKAETQAYELSKEYRDIMIERTLQESGLELA